MAESPSPKKNGERQRFSPPWVDRRAPLGGTQVKVDTRTLARVGSAVRTIRVVFVEGWE